MQLRKKKGYRLVCHTGNMILLKMTYHLIKIDEIDFAYPERLFISDWVDKPPSLLFRLLKVLLPRFIKI